MGYPLGTKSYRVQLAEEGKSTIRRNLVFDENTLYMKSKGKEIECALKAKIFSFKADLIQGPTRGGPSVEVGSTSGSTHTNEGGASSNMSRSSDSQGSEEETEQASTWTEESLSDYLLERDHVRRQTKPMLSSRVVTSQLMH